MLCSIDELALSFNGGKDCLVLLVLFMAALASTPGTAAPTVIQSVYVMSAHPFPEVDAFVDACVDKYRLGLVRYAPPMKTAFETYLREQPRVRAVFVGTRRTDPHGADLTHFDVTDHGWPSFMRCHPVIDWHYQEVWAVCLSQVGDLWDTADMGGGYSSCGTWLYPTAVFTIRAIRASAAPPTLTRTRR